MLSRALVLALVVGCSGATSPAQLPTSLHTAQISGATPPLVITTSPNTLRIQWWIRVNEPCYEFSASAQAPGDSLVVTLTAMRGTGFCDQLPTGYAYDLAISRVRSGQVSLSLIYDRHGPPTYRETVIDTTLAVP
jgi:hypothetical protein